jgi:DNA helicase-2/ATP-dependent DNA helicase PcrA
LTRELILGPPGTGKTTALLDIVDEYLQGGVSPERIAYVSFTQKAAYEARDRAMARFNYTRDDFPYFRTLHSLASRAMGLKKDDFLYSSHYKEIGAAIGLSSLTGSKIDLNSTEMRGSNTGNHLLSMIDVARNKKMSLEDYKRTLPPSIWQYAIGRDGAALKNLFAELDDYKRTFGLRDFTDLMIEPVVLGYPPLDIDVAIIDEAQDLTAVQWDFVSHMLSRAKATYFAGDDDQAIYAWNGAAVDYFLHLKGSRRVLSKSYRLPRRPWIIANILAQRITERYSKNWTHNGGEGSVNVIESFKTAHILEGGEWMILARNNAYLKAVQTWLMNKGVSIRRHDYDVIDRSHVGAIHGWVDVTSGKKISGARAKQLYSLLRTQRGVGYGGKTRLDNVDDEALLSFDDLRNEFALLANPDADWWRVLDKIPEQKREYYRKVRAMGESLRNARVLLSTIHGVKGGEADNVLLLPDMARQTYKVFRMGSRYGNEEHRVFYVGASRAKKRLFICGAQAQHRYPFPKIPAMDTGF